jgi:hypothetical protein
VCGKQDIFINGRDKRLGLDARKRLLEVTPVSLLTSLACQFPIMQSRLLGSIRRKSFSRKLVSHGSEGSVKLTDPSMYGNRPQGIRCLCVDRSLFPPPPTFVGLLMLFSLVALSGLEFLSSWSTKCSVANSAPSGSQGLQGWCFSGNLDQTITQLNAPDNFWPQRHEPT